VEGTDICAASATIALFLAFNEVVSTDGSLGRRSNTCAWAFSVDVEITVLHSVIKATEIESRTIGIVGWP
jgi:hypothetical protein